MAGALPVPNAPVGNRRYGQNVNGTIVGTVTDATDASVPAPALPSLTKTPASTMPFKPTQAATIAAPDLPPGTYKVSVQKEGFATSVHIGDHSLCWQHGPRRCQAVSRRRYADR